MSNQTGWGYGVLAKEVSFSRPHDIAVVSTQSLKEQMQHVMLEFCARFPLVPDKTFAQQEYLARRWFDWGDKVAAIYWDRILGIEKENWRDELNGFLQATEVALQELK